MAKSSGNTEPEQQSPQTQRDIAAITSPPATVKDSQIATIESDLERERDSRKEERFCWIAGMIALADVFVFPNATSATGIALLGTFQILFLFFLAAHSGLDHFAVVLSKVLSRLLKEDPKE